MCGTGGASLEVEQQRRKNKKMKKKEKKSKKEPREGIEQERNSHCLQIFDGRSGGGMEGRRRKEGRKGGEEGGNVLVKGRR